MNKFQEKYDELSESLNSSNDKLRELRDKFESKEKELDELKNYVFNKENEVRNEIYIRDDMVNSKTKKLDKWTFNISVLTAYLIALNLYLFVLDPYVFDGFLLKITNEFLSGVALVGVSVASLISLGAIFFTVIGVSISIKDAINKRMVSKIKNSKDYIKEDKKVLALEQELKEARQKKSSVRKEFDDLSINISYEENVSKDIKEKIENLRNEIVSTVIVDKKTTNNQHKNKTRVRIKKEENI